MEIVMLKCGCNGMATHASAHDGLAEHHPSCIIHETCEVVETPDFTGRMARCDGYGKTPGPRNECGECRENTVCKCEQPSSPNLAFFVHKPKEEFDEFYCGCTFGWD